MKVLKQLVRDVIEPTRDLGHVDRNSKEGGVSEASDPTVSTAEAADNRSGETTVPTDPDAAIVIGPPDQEGHQGKANELGL